MPNQLLGSDIDIIFAETILTHRNVPFHVHPRWELIYQRDGVTKTFQEHYSYIMRPGMILVHPPLLKHRDVYLEDYSIYYIQFNASSEISWPTLAYDDYNQTVGRLCELIYREYHTNGLGKSALMGALSIELDIFMRRLNRQSSGSTMAHMVSEAKRILEERYSSPPSMEELASNLGVSPSTFYSRFKDIARVSPKQYLMSVRMDHALGLIRHTSLSLDEIATTCGFNSASHLGAQVKNQTGLSPSLLRRHLDLCLSETG